MGKRKKWSVEDIPDLFGKVIVVTGANSGIGYEAAREFARKGAHTILACRNMDKAQKALAQILEESPDAQAEIMALDLADLASVRAFAASYKARFDGLDVLLNNAGIMMVPYGTTVDGFERQMGTNHLGHFALTGLLLECLQNTPKARVVNISSNGHRMGKMDFDNLLFEEGKGYSPTKAYGRAKLANLLFTYELQRRFVEHQVDAIALAAHPGASDTHLGDHLMDKFPFRLLMPFVSVMLQSGAMGALPSLRACVDLDAKGGEYYGPSGLLETKGHPVIVKSNKASHDLEDARRLWEASETLTDVSYPW